MLPSTEFIRELRSADSEKRIESIYHNELRKGINSLGGHVGSLKTLYNTDGVLDGEFYFDGTAKVFRIIIETKSNESFTNAVTRSKVLTQVLYYLKRFEESGDDLLPNIIFVGDRDECFVVHTNYLQNYLNFNCDWTVAASSASSKNPTLVMALSEDSSLQEQCFVHIIDDNFEFSDVTNEIYNLTIGIKMNVRITERNIAKIFERFSMHILKRKNTGESQYTPREQVEFFMGLVLHQDECYLHPRKKGTAIINGAEVKVEPDAFSSFLTYYEFNYNALEKKEFTAIADRLIEDSDRRRKGDFYTPTLWVDEAHKLLSQNLGAKWKDDYMVWDCAWGTGNLTRDYRFWDLYCSTLEEHDLKIGAKYHNSASDSAIKFQYDFLNDDVELFDGLLQKVHQGYKLTEKDFYGSKLWQKAPGLIRGMLGGKKLLFLINPPYGRASGVGFKQSNIDEGATDTGVSTVMKKYGWGSSSSQLYTQFMARIYYFSFLTDISLGCFTKDMYKTSGSFASFREQFCCKFEYLGGMLFQASHFADVSGAWAIDFSVWGCGKTEQKNSFGSDIKDLSSTGVVTLGRKVLYSVDKEYTLSYWLSEGGSKSPVVDFPKFTSGLITKETNYGCGKPVSSLGVMAFNGNNVKENTDSVYILSGGLTRNIGKLFITAENYLKSVSAFTARKLVTGKYSCWTNDKDEFLKPNTCNTSWDQWTQDCIVYSLFNTAANQTSLRQIGYNGKTWDVYNHFFFMSKEEMKQLSLGSNPNDEVFDDLENHADSERFVYEKLQQVQLSPDAQAVLDKARQLVRDSFKYRKLFAQEHPEYHIETWDAGWYQIKGLLKEYMPDQLKEFNQLYKSFEDRMRPLVVELGFLYDYPGYEKEKPSIEG